MVYCTTVKTQTQTNLYLQYSTLWYIHYTVLYPRERGLCWQSENSKFVCAVLFLSTPDKSENWAYSHVFPRRIYTVQYILFVISSSQEGFSALSPQNLAIHCHSALSLRVVLHTAEFYTVYLYFIWMYGWFLRYVHGTVKSDFAMTHRGVSFDFWRRKKSR